MGVSAFHRAYWDGRAYRRTKIYQRDHTFQFGDVVRWNGTEWVLASASDTINAEAIGVISHTGYRGSDDTLASADYQRRAIPSYAFDHRTQTETECNDPRHFFSVVFRGEITIPDTTDLDYDQNSFLTGTDSVPQTYTPGGVYYLSPFPGEEGKLIAKSPLEFGGKQQMTVVKPMLIGLDSTRAVVVNYIGSTMEHLPDEFIRIQDVQKVGAIGAFMQESVPESWIVCDGRLCTTAQYSQLGNAIGGSVRVPAKFSVDTDAPSGDGRANDGYFLLDFSDEGIDVSVAIIGEPLNIKLESSTSRQERAVIIDAIVDENTLRVIHDTSNPIPGVTSYTEGVEYSVKVRAPFLPGVDSLFFVPNLRNRTVKGAGTIEVWDSNPQVQYELGDYSGSNTAELNTGSDVASGTDFSATVDVRADATKVVFAIKTKAVDCGSFINECCSAVVPVGLNDNVVVNGAFLVWQRGKEFSRTIQSASVQPQYTADRWFQDFSVSAPIEPPTLGSYHLLKKGVKYGRYNPGSFPVPLAPGQSTGQDNLAIDLQDDITSYAQFQGTLMSAENVVGDVTYEVTDPSTGLIEDRETYHYLENRIEDVRTLSGETVTLSFWARGTVTGSIYLTLRQHFAGNRGILDDAYSAPVQIGLDSSANWRKYEIELDIPPVQESKPADGYIGSNSFLGVQFWTMYFAGACTGTPNPEVWDVIATPPPESDTLPLGPGGGNGDGVPPASGCDPLCVEFQAVRYYSSCGIWQCGICEPGDLCGTSASGGIGCCACTTVDVGQTICVGSEPGCIVTLPQPGGFTVINPTDRCGVEFRVWVIKNPDCPVLPGKYCCSDNTGGIVYDGACLQSVISDPDWNIAAPPGNPNSICSNAVAGGIHTQGALQNGSCGCAAGDGTLTDDEVADALCACCSCGADGKWGCPPGGGGETPTPTATETPPPESTPPSPSPSESGTPVPSVTSSRTPQPTPTSSPVTPTPTSSPVTPTPSPTPREPFECVTNCCLPVLFDADFNYEGVVHLTGVQLIRGKTSVPFQETDYLEELKKCQRFFEKDGYFAMGGSTNTTASPTNFYDSLTYMVPKRTLREPCVKIQGYYDTDGVTGCTLDTLTVDCFNQESAVLNLEVTPTTVEQSVCAAYIEYEMDCDLYETDCPNDPYCGTSWVCAWEEVP